MPSTSKKQHNFMAAIAHSPEFAKKAGVSTTVGKHFMDADKGKKFSKGGTMKHEDIKQDMPMMAKVASKAVKGHEKRMHGMAKGGVTRADGCVSKGHTKGTMIKMKNGGMC
jgi:hypothetical protein